MAYVPLDRNRDEIRLVQILPPAAGHGIRLAINSYSLCEAPPYIALSYEWGESQNQHYTIDIDGTPFDVRQNLWDFLQRICHVPEIDDERFWIDALCINQSDTAERTHQVGLMAQVFSRAKVVVAWLGAEDQHSKVAFDFLSGHGSPYGNDDYHVWFHPTIVSIAKFCSRKYWSRLWVLQELVVAREVLLFAGHDKMLWQDLVNFIAMADDMSNVWELRRSAVYKNIMSSPAASMAKACRGKNTPKSLYDLMVMTSRLRCSETKDKAYALLGIAKEGYDKTIIPDYSTCVCDILRSVLEHSKTLDASSTLDQVRETVELLSKAVGQSSGWLYRLNSCCKLGTDPEMLVTQEYWLLDSNTSIPFWWLHQHDYARAADDWLQNNSLHADFVQAANDGHLRVWKMVIPFLFADRSAKSLEDHRWAPYMQLAVETKNVDVFRLLLDGCKKYSTISTEIELWSLNQAIDNKELREAVPGPTDIAESCNLSLTKIIHWSAVHNLHKLTRCLLLEVDVKELIPLVEPSNDMSTLRYFGKNVVFDERYSRAAHTEPILHAVIRRKLVQMAKLLLTSPDLDRNMLNWLNQTPLMVSVQLDRPQMVQLLLAEPTCQVNHQDHRGETALHLAVTPDILQLLLEHPEIDVNLVDEFEKSALMYIVTDTSRQDLVKPLVQRHDLLVNSQNRAGETVLMMAVRSSHVAVVKNILDRDDVDVNTVSHTGATALTIALDEMRRRQERATPTWTAETKELIRLLLDARGMTVRKTERESLRSACPDLYQQYMQQSNLD